MRKQTNGPLRSKFSWTLLGNVTFQASQWLILATLAKLGNVNMVGQYALALAISTPIMILMNLQLRTIQATDTENKYKFYDFFNIRFYSNILFIVIIVIIIYFMKYDNYVSVVIIIISTTKVVESFSDLIYGYNQKYENMKGIAISQILKGVISFSLFSISLYISNDLRIASLGILSAYLLILFFIDIRILINYHVKFFQLNNKVNFKLIKVALPLGIVLLLSSLNTNIPRFFIERIGGSEQLGYFAAISYLIVAGNTIIVSLGQTAAPRLAKYVANKQFEKFISLLKRLLCIGGILGLFGLIVIILFGGNLLELAYTKDYAMYNNLFILLMFVGSMDYISSFFGYGLTALRNFNIQPKIAIFWTLNSLILSFILIPPLGLNGAGFALLISSFIRLILQLLAFLYSYKRGKELTMGDGGQIE